MSKRQHKHTKQPSILSQLNEHHEKVIENCVKINDTINLRSGQIGIIHKSWEEKIFKEILRLTKEINHLKIKISSLEQQIQLNKDD